jgi:hypothetical protein
MKWEREIGISGKRVGNVILNRAVKGILTEVSVWTEI